MHSVANMAVYQHENDSVVILIGSGALTDKSIKYYDILGLYR